MGVASLGSTRSVGERAVDLELGRALVRGRVTCVVSYRSRSLRLGGQLMNQRLGYSLAVVLVFLSLVAPSRAAAQDKPRAGGELIFVVAAEPPSFDAHQEETFAMLHPGAPQYNTLMRVDPGDRTGTKLVGDLAESWTISPDRRIYTFKVRKGVKFHDGSVMTSADV